METLERAYRNGKGLHSNFIRVTLIFDHYSRFWDMYEGESKVRVEKSGF